MIASYSASLLEAEKFKCMACSMTSPVGALSCSPKPALICHEPASTFRVHQLELSGSISYWGISVKKSANTYPFNARQGLNRMPNSLNSIAHRAICLEKSSLCIMLLRGRLVSTVIKCAWK